MKKENKIKIKLVGFRKGMGVKKPEGKISSVATTPNLSIKKGEK